MSDPNWRALNRTMWDERVPIHLASSIYSAPLQQSRMNAIEEDELSPVDGLRLLHLQCHFGRDTLMLALRGATVVGIDFSPPAIAAARTLAAELDLGDRARFIESDLYDAPNALPEPASFDRVFVTWGAICWLPDIIGWARIIVHFLRPGGSLYFAEAHPAALVLDDAARLPNGLPGFYLPYFHTEPLILENTRDYADPKAKLTNTTTCEWIHPVGKVVTALIEAGLRLDWLHEHDRVAWRMFACQVEDSDGMFRWPDRPLLPLAYSLRATKPAA